MNATIARRLDKYGSRAYDGDGGKREMKWTAATKTHSADWSKKTVKTLCGKAVDGLFVWWDGEYAPTCEDCVKEASK